jgi:hypothetical protein
MGHYSVLKIDDEELLWKYDIPSFLSFLFVESDQYAIPDDEELPRMGFKTSCELAIKKLDQLGFDWKMITEIYEYFYDDLKAEVYDSMEESLRELYEDLSEEAREEKITAYLNKIPKFSRVQELKDFTAFLKPLIAVSVGKRNLNVKSIDGKIYKIKKENDASIFRFFLGDPKQFLYGKELQLPPWIQIIGGMFDFDLLQEYMEILSVVQLKILLEASHPEAIVDLQLEDIIDEEDELKDFHISSANRLIGKINLYNKFFTSIMSQETVIRDLYFKQQLKQLADNLSVEKSNFEKGKSLEELMELIFSSVHGLQVTDKRIATGDEEIDLQIKNNVNGAFWTGLTSPLLFVECKNWTASVGAKEIRDFEVKMINHGKMVKVGIFVAYNGFTSEAVNALKRMGRSDHHIVLIDGNDIKDLISTKTKTIDWLEKLISKLY